MIVWVTLALIAICGIYGWRAGVVRRLVELAGVVAAILLSARFASAVAPWLADHSAMDDTTALVAAYILVFVAALVAVRVIASAVARFVRWTPLGWLDRLGGAVCGAAIGALLVSVGLIAVSQAPRGEAVRSAYVERPVGEVIYYAAPSVYQAARQLFGGEVDELWERAVDLKDRVVEEAERAASGQG
jgi:membrane protein required for colicin V production